MAKHLVLLAIAVFCAAYLLQNFVFKHNLDIITKDIKDEYDYVVVGAGSAGSVLSARLAEDEHVSVLVLEAGGHFAETPLTDLPGGWAALLRSDFDWAYFTEKDENMFKGMNGNKCFWPRGRTLGGSGVLNGLQYTRGSRFDYDGWADNGCKGWDYKSVLPYFLKFEDVQIPELKSSPYHSTGGPIVVTHNPPSGLTPLFMKAGQELGYNVTDYNGELQEGFSPIQCSVRNGIRSSAAHEYIAKNKRQNLNIGTRAYVTKIIIEDKKATGVTYIRNGRKYFVKARKEVIVSSGAINTPQLLMLSGIGPRKHLESLGIPVVADLPVGQNLQDHQLNVLSMPIKDKLGVTTSDFESTFNQLQYKFFKTGPYVRTGLDGSAFLHVDPSRSKTSSPDVQMIFFNLLFTPDLFFNYNDKVADEVFEKDATRPGFTTMVCSTRPKSTGTIQLKSRDPFDSPSIDARYYSDYTDMQTMIKSIRIWEKWLQTPTMKKIGADVSHLKKSFCSQHAFLSDEYWECYIRHTSSTEYHPCCTASMGADSDPRAVLDLELKVRGIANLRVVDASVMPNITSGNLNTPTMMIAERAADLIKGKDSVSVFRNLVKNIQ